MSYKFSTYYAKYSLKRELNFIIQIQTSATKKKVVKLLANILDSIISDIELTFCISGIWY